MECSEARAAIEAEGPVDAALLERAGRHLERCEHCRSRLDAEALPAGLLERHRAPADLVRRIGAALDGAARARTAPARRPILRSALALAAAFAVGVGAALAYATYSTAPDAGQRLIEEAVTAHVRSRLGDSSVQIASSDRHTVKPWFAGRLDLSPPVKDLAAEGFPLLGGRVDYLGHRPVAVLVYRHRQHLIDLAVLPADGQAVSEGRSSNNHGYSVLRWTAGGFSFLAVSDLGSQDMAKFQGLVAAP